MNHRNREEGGGQHKQEGYVGWGGDFFWGVKGYLLHTEIVKGMGFNRGKVISHNHGNGRLKSESGYRYIWPFNFARISFCHFDISPQQALS